MPNLPPNLPRNSDCPKGHFVNINVHQRSSFAQIAWCNTWGCPGCKAYKLSTLTKALVSRVDTLCWGPWTKRQSLQGRTVFTLRFDDDSPIMVAESHIYEPQLPSEVVVNQIIEHASIRNVVRLDWSDKWRIKPETNPDNWDPVFPKEKKSLAEINAALEKAGADDYKMGKKSRYELTSNLEQILNGVSFNSPK